MKTKNSAQKCVILAKYISMFNMSHGNILIERENDQNVPS